jgi:hypothetical protein
MGGAGAALPAGGTHPPQAAETLHGPLAALVRLPSLAQKLFLGPPLHRLAPNPVHARRLEMLPALLIS